MQVTSNMIQEDHEPQYRPELELITTFCYIHTVNHSSSTRFPECHRVWLDKRRLSLRHGFYQKSPVSSKHGL